MITFGSLNVNFIKMQKQQLGMALILGALCFFSFQTESIAQCETWESHEEKDDIMGSYSVLQDFIDSESYTDALPYWENVYTKAPAGSGKDAYVYQYGRDIFINFIQNETDAAKKQEYIATVQRLHEEEMVCFPEEKGLTLANLAFDMFYYLQTPYSKLMETVDQSIEIMGDKAEYAVFVPYGFAAVYQFQNEFIDAEQARNAYLKLEAIHDARIADKDLYAEQYSASWENVKAQYKAIESQIFDCDYYKNKFKPDFDAGEEDLEVLKYMVVMMTKQGCSEEDAFVVEVTSKYETLAAEVNARKLKEYFASNPAAHAADLYKNEDFQGAFAKYEEAVEKEIGAENDEEKLAQYYFSMASISGRKLKQYSKARNFALKAANLRSGWGQPYLLIGDLYASSSRNCGSNDWDRSLAVLAAIDKYQYAKAVDSTIASEANKKISNYRDFIPSLEDGFQRGIKEGKTLKVNCWIGEKVKVRYQ